MQKLNKKQNAKPVGAGLVPAQNKGITLIALIITIIVMLILVGVTINVALNGGLFKKAETAKEGTQKAADEEELQLEIVTAYNEKTGEVELSTLKTKLEAKDWKNVTISGDKLTCTSPKGNEFTVTKDGIIGYVKDGEDEVTHEMDIAMVAYTYNTMYNPSQPEIISASNYDYYDDENDDRISDINSSLSAYLDSGDFDIPLSFFTEEIPSEGDIEAIITHYSGLEEKITLTTTDNKVWKAELTASEVFEEGDVREIRFCPYAQHDSFKWPEYYKDSTEYHYLDLGETCLPFYKISILGRTIEFPFNCQATVYCGNLEEEILEPMYTNIENVNKITLNFSNNTKRVYTKEDIFDAALYMGDSYFYSSEDVPILYYEGIIVINMPYPSLQVELTSIIIDEDGMLTKCNFTDSTMIIHGHPGS